MGYLVLQYDASVDQSPDLHQNIIFHKKFVGTQNDQQTITLEQIMQDYHFDPSAHNILQVDIEGTEWDIFEKLDLPTLEKYFAQIIVEFHECDPRAASQLHRHLAVLEKLHQAFQPIHAHCHACAFGPIHYVKDRFFTNNIEVSYARRDLLPEGTVLRDICGDIAGLDYPTMFPGDLKSTLFPSIPIYFT